MEVSGVEEAAVRGARVRHVLDFEAGARVERARQLL